MNTGARCIWSSTTVVLTPPHSLEQAHAAVVAGDQRALGGRQRNIEVSLGVLAVDAQRTGHADRNLRDAGEVLDVARQHARVERELPDVIEACSGLVAQELPAVRRDFGRVVVFRSRGEPAAL